MKNRKLKAQYRLLGAVKKRRKEMEALSDEELSRLTRRFKKRLRRGASPDSLLPEAYAAICEADRRILGLDPYDVQILGAIALHQGYLAEMGTGEGKTLTVTMPLYLNALTGKSTILVTANDYLAQRDAREMGPVYRFMGLTVACGVQGKPDNSQKKEIYASDIVYTTYGALGYDYLFNNLVTSGEDRFLRPLHYVIIDEADSVLLDGAQMPLVISGSPRPQSALYDMTDFFALTLQEEEDYEKEDRSVYLTEKGAAYAERFFQIDNFYAEEHFEINRHVNLALRAHALFEAGKDYLPMEGEVVLIDRGTGRAMRGVKLHGGQHQALEAREKAEISQETRAMASITFQNLFLLFDKMAGMSGTLADGKEEFRNIYQKKVLVIPPNRPLVRRDLPDRVCRTVGEQIERAVQLAVREHRKGRPVLMVAISSALLERISSELTEREIPHNVLNTQNTAWEAQIISEAGQTRAVTVAMPMAGRGTDIRLSEEARALGGLAMIGVGRMANIRLERQARGRAGRQGDPGTSVFFVSPEDDTVCDYLSEKVRKRIMEKRHFRVRRARRLINRSRSFNSEAAYRGRAQSVGYDQVMKSQRELIYKTRNDLLDGQGMDSGAFRQLCGRSIRLFVQEQKEMDPQILNRYILDNLSCRLDGTEGAAARLAPKELEKYLLARAGEMFAENVISLGSERAGVFMRQAALAAVDEAWTDQVDYLQQLRYAVTGRATARRNILYEYQREALESFRKMEKRIQIGIMRNILLGRVSFDKNGRMSMLLP